MAHFSDDQLKELSLVFGIPLLFKVTEPEFLPIRDGNIAKNEKVWWREETGPTNVEARRHWKNIKDFPHLYSHVKPVVVKVIYQD